MQILMASTARAQRIAALVRELAAKSGPHMAAAERAIIERIPLVDLVIEVRDARVPLTSAFQSLRNVPCFRKHMIVLNKMDIADRSITNKWVMHLKDMNCFTCGVNAHNKESMKELSRNIQARVKQIKAGMTAYTASVMLVGIPNVGKSAIANSLHLIGRIDAAEKGKLRHALVSPCPCETKDISSYKIASHPNLYVLDTPGVLSPKVDDNSGPKLALAGAVKDSIIGELELARYCLTILNSGEEYRKWEHMNVVPPSVFPSSARDEIVTQNQANVRKMRQYSCDHTQDFIVNNVRRTLYETISSSNRHFEDENEMENLIDFQLIALQEAFQVSMELYDDGYEIIAKKLLNLYRTGRLGHYSMDLVPNKLHENILQYNSS